MSFSRHKKIYQSDGTKRRRNRPLRLPGDHRSDESSAGYSFLGCSPAVPTSASPAATTFSHYPAAVNCSAAKRNLSPFSLSQSRGPLQVMAFGVSHFRGAVQSVTARHADQAVSRSFPTCDTWRWHLGSC